MRGSEPAAGAGEVEVSPARPEEYATLGGIVVAAYRHVDGAWMSDGYAATIADVGGRAAQPGVVVLAARIEGQPVGCATVALSNSDFAEGDAGDDAAVLRMVGVDPAFQGLGAGRALVAVAAAIARESERRRLILFTQPVMTSAQRLYESLGFLRRPETDWQVPDGPALLGYELAL